MDEPKHPVSTVDRTLDIVETVQELDGAGVSEIADRVEVGKSAVHNHLATLENRGYVVKDGDEYHVGLAFLGLGAYARQRTDIYRVARSKVEDLAEETGELANLLVEKDGLGCYLYQARGEVAVELDTYAGKRVHLHCTGLGKAILAFRPEDEVVDVLEDRGMPEHTQNTTTDVDEFLEELSTVRERGYALDDEERLTGLQCVAAPVTDDENRSIAAVSVSYPVHRTDSDSYQKEVVKAVLGVANVVELEYNYS
jgi:DNA-binding IclR family transcriptional regulator